MSVRRCPDASEVIRRVGDARFRASGPDGELSFGLMRRLVDHPSAWGPDVTLLLDLAGGAPRALVSLAGPHPALIVGFGDAPDVDHDGLVQAMLAAGRRPAGVNGAERWSDPHAEAWRRVAGVSLQLQREMQGYELREVIPPRPVTGGYRPAFEADEELLTEWMFEFGAEIGEPWSREEARSAVQRLTSAGDFAVWAVAGEVVSTAAVNRRTPWSSTVALVYTPAALRGHGYASAVVAALSARELAAGAEWCSLFADLANPTANHVYAAIGYQPVVTFRHQRLVWPQGT